MKVCVLSSGSFERNYSSYHLMRDLILYLRENGDEVSLIQKYSEQPEKLPTEFHGQDICVHEIRFAKVEKANMVKRMLADIKYYFKSAKHICSESDSDVFFLQSNNVPCVPIALIHLLARKPVVYNVQDIFPQNAFIAGILKEKSLPAKVLLLLQRWALKHADRIITISEDMKQTLISAGADPRKISVAYNWENEIHGEPIAKVDDGRFHVVYAGNIGVMQNVELIIEAAKLLRENSKIVFDIYGSGTRENKCKKMAQNLSNVCFHSSVLVNQAFSLYLNADLNIIPLVPRGIMTAFPSKTATCVSCGKPVLFCVDKNSAWGKDLENSGGYVVNPNDYEELAEAIAKAVKVKNTDSLLVSGEIKERFQKHTATMRYRSVLIETVQNDQCEGA